MREVTKRDYSGQNIYAGIDVHKKSWTVTILTEQIEHKQFTQPPSAQHLSNYLHRVFPGAGYQVAYEAGFSGFGVHDEFKVLGIDCTLVHPGDVPTTDKERRHKSDSGDSRKIGRELRNGDLEAIYIPSKQNREDRGLVRQRKTTVKEVGRCKNRIKSHLAFLSIKIPPEFEGKYWSGYFLNWLDGLTFSESTGKAKLESLLRQLRFQRSELALLDRQLRKLSHLPVYADSMGYLISIPGIGRLSAIIWLTELEDIQRFKTLDKLCSYVGLVPWQRSSGETEHTGGLDHRGNKVLRTLVIENAWVAVRKDPDLMATYHDLTKRMKGQQAIIRIARKLLNRIRYVLKNECEYKIPE